MESKIYLIQKESVCYGGDSDGEQCNEALFAVSSMHAAEHVLVVIKNYLTSMKDWFEKVELKRGEFYNQHPFLNIPVRPARKSSGFAQWEIDFENIQALNEVSSNLIKEKLSKWIKNNPFNPGSYADWICDLFPLPKDHNEAVNPSSISIKEIALR